MHDAEEPGLRVGVVTLFGPTGVTLGDRRADVRGAKAQGLLALLALERGRFVHADRIASSLWDDVEIDTVASLRVRVSELRRAFDRCEPGARRYLEGRYPLYRLSDELTTDAEQAHALLDQAIAELPLDPAAAAERLARARHLVHGDPLAEILRLPFAPLAAMSLLETRLTIEDAHIDALMATGDLAAAATAARALVSAEPLREARVRVLASILAEQGASREALRELDRYATDLHREISTTPGAVFSELRERITRGWGPPTEADDRSKPEELDPQLARHITSTFIGRSEELALIENVHRTVIASGQSRAVEIVGIGGSGKSTLAAHAAAAAASRGSRVLYVAWPAEQHASLTPLAETGLIDPIRRHDSRPRNELRDLTREFVATLRADSSRTPLTVVFDDFQNAGAEAIALADSLLHDDQLRATFIIVRRTHPSGPATDAVGLAEHIAPQIALGPLRTEELDALREETTGGLSATTAMFPRVLAAIMHPSSLHLEDLIAPLPAPERAVLEVLALEPLGLRLAIVAACTTLTAQETLAALRRLIGDGLVSEIETEQPRFVVVHDVLMFAIHDAIGPAQRIAGSARLVVALHDAQAPPSAQIRHALNAADLIGRRAVDVARAALDGFVRIGALDEASSLAHECRSRLRLDPGDELYLQTVECFAEVASGRAPHRSEILLDIAADGAAIADWELVAKAFEYRQFLGQEFGRDDTGIRLLDQALDAVGPDEPVLRFSLLDRRIFSSFNGGEPPQQIGPLVDELLSIADEMREPSLRIRAAQQQHSLLSLVGPSARDLTRISERMMHYATASRDSLLIADAHTTATGTMFQLHDLEEVGRHGRALHDSLDPRGQWIGRLVSTALLLDQLEIDAAVESIEAHYAFAIKHGLQPADEARASQWFLVLWLQGALSTLTSSLAALDWRAPAQIVWGCALAMALAQSEPDAGRGLCDEIADAYADANPEWNEAPAMALLAEASWLTGSRAGAALAYSRLQRFRGRRAVGGGSTVDFGPVDRYLGLSLSVTGDHDSAIVELDRAALVAGCPLWAGRIRIDRELILELPSVEAPGAWSWVAAACKT